MRGYNSTIERKKKKCKRCGELNYLFSKGMCQPCWKIENYSGVSDDTESEHGRLIGLLDTVFSQYIRLKYSDEKGNVKCYTCPVVKEWTQMQNGHFIPRANMFTRFDERNCRPQCAGCNVHKNGNIGEFSFRLNQEQTGITQILYEEAGTVYKYSRHELKSLISQYHKKVSLLKEGIKK